MSAHLGDKAGDGSWLPGYSAHMIQACGLRVPLSQLKWRLPGSQRYLAWYLWTSWGLEWGGIRWGPCSTTHPPCLLAASVGLGKLWAGALGPGLVGLFPKNCPGAPGPPTPARTQPFPLPFSFSSCVSFLFSPAVLDTEWKTL